ncbi:MAG: glycosyltransferase family 2 protein [Lachnospiraceae bacterium]|nr:glycosyltransferase family 2 protein [Lachnospiraceae bacterium]
MEIVITMAGLGTRFRQAGYNEPKYMIKAHGRTLFEWAMESLKSFRRAEDFYTFIVRQEDRAASFIEEKCKDIQIVGHRVVELKNQTDGQATTAMLASRSWNDEDELLIYNIDTYVEAGCMNPGQIHGDGFIPCFKAEGDHWSFVRLNESGRAVEVREKERISDNCTLGAYYFRTCRLYETMYNEYYSDPSRLEKGEKYIAPLYNHMIEKGMKVYISDVDPQSVHVLGTPSELNEFIESYDCKKDQ